MSSAVVLARLMARNSIRSWKSLVRSHLAANRRRDLATFRDHLPESVRRQGLKAVAQGVLWIWMHFDDQAVGARGHGRPRHGRHQTCLSRAMARIHDDRQVR